MFCTYFYLPVPGYLKNGKKIVFSVPMRKFRKIACSRNFKRQRYGACDDQLCRSDECKKRSSRTVLKERNSKAILRLPR